MLITFKILEETLNNITMGLTDANFGTSLIKLNLLKMLDVNLEYNVKNAMDGWNKDTTLQKISQKEAHRRKKRKFKLPRTLSAKKYQISTYQHSLK